MNACILTNNRKSTLAGMHAFTHICELFTLKEKQIEYFKYIL